MWTRVPHTLVEDAVWTNEQRAEFGKLLTELKASLQEQLRAVTEGARPVSLDAPIGRLSRMDAMQQQQMAGAHKRSAELRLTQVNTALARLQTDGFGQCLRCGEQIGLERLRIRPEATLCRGCQEGGDDDDDERTAPASRRGPPGRGR